MSYLGFRHRGLVLFLAIFVLASTASAQRKQQVLHIFQGGADGASPHASLISDSHGNLYGTTSYGGSGACTTGVFPGCGTVFELSPEKSGWKETILYSFSEDGDGNYPYAPLVFDKNGSLYGVTESGGTTGDGAVFELSVVPGSGWAESVIHSFTGGSDGSEPCCGALVFDAVGNLYGTTLFGGGGGSCYFGGCGIIFELTPSDGIWQETVVHAFTGGTDGGNPVGLVVGAQGVLYGTTSGGGTSGPTCQGGCGTIFKLEDSTETVLYSFAHGSDGAFPNAPAVFDRAGNLYGTTNNGGPNDVGVVYELRPNKASWRESVLYSFTGGKDGGTPTAGVSFDNADNLFSTTAYGGYGFGTAFNLSYATAHHQENVLYNFESARGEYPASGVLVDKWNNLFGATSAGGNSGCNGIGCGVVFEIIQ